MTIEERIKSYILSRYKSLREFVNTSGIDLPYSTVDGMLKRGIGNASIGNVIKLCHALGISTDELANGKIVPAESVPKAEMPDLDLEKALRYMQNNYEDFEPLSIDGKLLSEDELDSFYFAIDTFIRFVELLRFTSIIDLSVSILLLKIESFTIPPFSCRSSLLRK